jgi:hypothetical protein
VSKNRHLQLFAQAAEELDVPAVAADTVFEELVGMYELALNLAPQDFRDIVFLLWALNAAYNAGVADLVIDVDLLGTSGEYRRAVEDATFAATGRPLCFEDVRHAAVPDAPGRPVSNRGCAWVRNAMRSLPCGADWSSIAMSPQSNRVLSHVL